MADEKHEDKKAETAKPTEVIGEHKPRLLQPLLQHILRPSDPAPAPSTSN